MPVTLEADTAIVGQGWLADGAPPNRHQIAGTISPFFSALEALDLLAGSRRESRQELTPNGRRALLVALRSRALGPRRRL